jgi:hypothetical protein
MLGISTKSVKQSVNNLKIYFFISSPPLKLLLYSLAQTYIEILDKKVKKIYNNESNNFKIYIFNERFL